MSFNNIRGQDRAISILKSYIARKRLSGGYLFCGPEGVGKKLTAITFAKALNCLEGREDGCDSCVTCRKIDNNQHPDVHLVENAEGEIKIEQIRRLQREIGFKPYEGRVKVFVINDAHTLTAEASNALLKILEEPPADSTIILVTDKPNLLFKTITSRCKSLRFSYLIRRQLEEAIRKDYALDNDTAHFLAYYSEGRLGCSLRLKDPDILRKKNSTIDAFTFSRKAAYDNLDMQDKKAIRSSLNILASWFRDIYLLKIGMPHHELINFDRKADLLKQMGRFSFSELNDILDTVSDSIKFLEQNLNTRIILNNLGVRLWKD